MAVELEVSGCTLVLVGQFNPAIFHPAWFRAHDLISAKEAEEADVKVVHPDISHMIFGGMTFVVEHQRCTIATMAAPLIRAADLALQLFSVHLTHTPMTQAGVNTTRHYRLPSEKARHAFGRRLAPLQPWGQWGDRLDERRAKDVENGVQMIAMREYWEDDPWNGWIQTKVEPSTVISNNQGVYVEKNHHIMTDTPSARYGAPEIVQYIADSFDQIIEDSDWIEGQLFAEV